MLERVEFRNARGGVRRLPVKGGKLASVTSVQGQFYRLTEESAAALDRVVEGE